MTNSIAVVQTVSSSACSIAAPAPCVRVAKAMTMAAKAATAAASVGLMKPE